MTSVTTVTLSSEDVTREEGGGDTGDGGYGDMVNLESETADSDTRDLVHVDTENTAYKADSDTRYPAHVDTGDKTDTADSDARDLVHVDTGDVLLADSGAVVRCTADAACPGPRGRCVGGTCSCGPGHVCDPCRGDPCHGGGTCEPHDGTFSCHCAEGRAGQRCEVTIYTIYSCIRITYYIYHIYYIYRWRLTPATPPRLHSTASPG